MNKRNKDIIITGFALFAMFFGAGNLIFPPFLGLISGSSWLTGFTGFILADVGLSLLAILAIAKCDGDVGKIFSRAGHKISLVLACSIMICIGPLLAIPRTAATTFEMGVQPIFSGFSSIIFSIIFFGVTLLLTIRPSKVVDIIGSYLTPALLIALLTLIGVGIFNPLGSIEPATIEGVFSEGIFQGYQTLDALGAVSLSAVIFTTIANKGYTKKEDKINITFKAGLIAAAGLFLVYGGLTYLGATVSTMFDSNVSQAGLIVAITENLLGFPGKVILGIIVTLACLTTAIGLTSATGQYFSKLSNNKIKYETIVTAVCLFSLVVSNFGVDTIIKFSAPILTVIYPPTIVLVVFTLLGQHIKNDNIFKFATYTALVMGFLNILGNFGVKVPVINTLPLHPLGFNWVVPVLIASAIGFFIKSNSSNAKSDSKNVTA
ncbi:branched-chain amino acid transport system II carrier protein [Terrisporobacter petrolearius]|uniref:branched-chain amino acid transport system II carrier protein n=1 Tax=Terrisporobacter petrolearius TaxID=1460447 RepID=UPI001D166FF8|nr:branched-chain amino acid transport system II carrier protein [Terrisporobacter petrolearius]MCC3864386.1 branched-chain amino acid transport system II carrier protein [Terrisporobacter petrolearius]